MKLRSIFLMLFISVGLFSFALLSAYFFWWTEKNDADSLKYGFIFLSIGGSVLVLAILISLLIFLPRDGNVDSRIYFDNERFGSLITPRKMKFFKIVATGLNFPLFALFIFLFYFTVKEYEYHHLKTFGQRSKVVIQEMRKSKKGIPFALVEFEHKGQSYLKELLAEKYHTGDTVEIIFSTKRTEIVMWYDEFKKK